MLHINPALNDCLLNSNFWIRRSIKVACAWKINADECVGQNATNDIDVCFFPSVLSCFQCFISSIARSVGNDWTQVKEQQCESRVLSLLAWLFYVMIQGGCNCHKCDGFELMSLHTSTHMLSNVWTLDAKLNMGIRGNHSAIRSTRWSNVSSQQYFKTRRRSQEKETRITRKGNLHKGSPKSANAAEYVS